MKSITYISILSFLLLTSCHRHGVSLKIAGSIDEPKNEIVKTLVELINEKDHKHVELELVNAGTPHIDSLIKGVYDLMIVDNNIDFQNDVSVVIPLYSQILHILHKTDYQPQTIYDLLENKKVFAGQENTGSRKLVDDLIIDFQVDRKSIEFVDIIDLFNADVILLFTDLISFEELIDLSEYQFYSLDSTEKIGQGTLAEAISLRYPEFQPYILPSYVYGKKTSEPVLTVSNEAILICRNDVDQNLVYDVTKLINDHKQMLYAITPLLNQSFDENYNTENLVFPLHEGARGFLERDQPTILERYSGLFGILLTLLIAAMSGLFTLFNYREQKKKDIIDKYYAKLISIRHSISHFETQGEIDDQLLGIKHMQNETIDLVIEEKLSANESYLVFMKLVDIVVTELKQRQESLGS